MWPFARRESYTGRDCYKYTEDILRHGKEVMIVSPYIDLYYARFLKSISGNKRIRVISSSIEKDALKELSSGKSLGLSIAAFTVILSSDYLLHNFGLLYPVIIAVSAILIIIAVLPLFLRKSSIVIKRPNSFVHAKMYITEECAVQGSANLTYNGMHRNVEHIEITKEKEKIKALRKEFFKIWDGA